MEGKPCVTPALTAHLSWGQRLSSGTCRLTLRLKFTSRSSGPVSAKLMALEPPKSTAAFSAIYRTSQSTKATKRKRSGGAARLSGTAAA